MENDADADRENESLAHIRAAARSLSAPDSSTNTTSPVEESIIRMSEGTAAGKANAVQVLIHSAIMRTHVSIL